MQRHDLTMRAKSTELPLGKLSVMIGLVCFPKDCKRQSVRKKMRQNCEGKKEEGAEVGAMMERRKIRK